MKRMDFLKALALAPLATSAIKLKEFEKATRAFSSTDKLPVLFIGHGHPMNALFDNDFTRALRETGRKMEKPKAIMVISAHWETSGTFVSVNAQPKAIYDFGRFDDALLKIRYEPAGSPLLAREVISQLPLVKEDQQMGLDHGAWTILKFLFPEADVPVFQLSIDYTRSPQEHFELAQALRKMREKGVLIIGSGNIVHNLGLLDWRNIKAKTDDWALEFDNIVKNKLSNQDFKALVNYKSLGKSALLSIPTEDHYIPLIYALGLASAGERITYLYEGFQYANISMRCLRIG